jgi:hypothetical protein
MARHVLGRRAFLGGSVTAALGGGVLGSEALRGLLGVGVCRTNASHWLTTTNPSMPKNALAAAAGPVEHGR